MNLSNSNEFIGNLSGNVWVKDMVRGDLTKGSNCIVLIPGIHGILYIKR